MGEISIQYPQIQPNQLKFHSPVSQHFLMELELTSGPTNPLYSSVTSYPPELHDPFFPVNEQLVNVDSSLPHPVSGNLLWGYDQSNQTDLSEFLLYSNLYSFLF
jgi:hypothetical protein